jgi:hypothetical protein
MLAWSMARYLEVHPIQRRPRREGRVSSGVQLQWTSMIVIGIACLVLAAVWLPLARRTEPSGSFMVMPWQRWSTYGARALVLGIAYAVAGVAAVAVWLVHH